MWAPIILLDWCFWTDKNISYLPQPSQSPTWPLGLVWTTRHTRLWGSDSGWWCSGFISRLHLDVGCEIVPWLPEETGACAGGHEPLPPEDPQHRLWGALLPPDVWGSSWLRQEDGGWLHVWPCPAFSSSLWLCNVRQRVIEIIFLVCSHQDSSSDIWIWSWLYQQIESPFLNAQELPDTSNYWIVSARWFGSSFISLFDVFRSISGLPW